MKNIIITALLVLLNWSMSIAQCAMCKGAIQTNMSTGKNVIGNGINIGIAYLFVFPYITVGVIAYLWYRNSKKAMEDRLAIRNRAEQALK